ncbi:Sodium/hydrogen exchanger family-domain-containing protein [Chlamydoabsidia padenii]|nr:Sodium/hydrogen exchanger family-domain-containing protein [Chlamydoabsidia padenii]
MAVDLIPGEFSSFTVAIAVLSGFIVFFGYISMFLKERMFLSEAFVALVIGIISGPLVTNAINPYNWPGNDEFTKQLTRCIIAVQVMAVGIELPKHYMKKEWLTMLMLLFPVMMFMWLISGLFIWALIPPVSYLEALVISACICPTDPILANSVVKGRFAEKHVPSHIRNALSAESGANDGMGFPFLFLAIFLLGEDSVGVAIGKWIYVTCLFQIALSCVIGIIVGYLARKLLQWSEKHHLIDKPSFLSFAIALALFLMSMTGFSGSDDVLACFVAGNAFSWDAWFRKETEEAHFQDVIDMMLNLAIFVYIGAIIPWDDFGNVSLGLAPWRLVVLSILVLLFRRLPIVLLLKPVMPSIKTYREALFSGWFGPMGVGAVFLSKIAKEQMAKIYVEQDPVAVRLINPVVLFIVLSSVLVHGTTIPLFKLGKRIRSRTLSITSISSGASQVLHLPKFQHRRSEDDLLHHYHHPKTLETTMTELQRNTLFNTIQREHPSSFPIQPPSATTTIIIGGDNDGNSSIIQIHEHDNDDSTDNEEDYLSDNYNGDDKRIPSPSSSSSSSPSSHHLHQQQSQHHPSPLGGPVFLGSGRYRRASTATLETQGIRFLEPTKPKMSSQTNITLLMDRNESSVSSFKSWISKHTKDTHHNHSNNSKGEYAEDVSAPCSNHTLIGSPQVPTQLSTTTKGGKDETTKQHHHHSGLRHFFSSSKEATHSINSDDRTATLLSQDHQQKLDIDGNDVNLSEKINDKLLILDKDDSFNTKGPENV